MACEPDIGLYRHRSCRTSTAPIPLAIPHCAGIERAKGAPILTPVPSDDKFRDHIPLVGRPICAGEYITFNRRDYRYPMLWHHRDLSYLNLSLSHKKRLNNFLLFVKRFLSRLLKIRATAPVPRSRCARLQGRKTSTNAQVARRLITRVFGPLFDLFRLRAGREANHHSIYFHTSFLPRLAAECNK